MISDDEDLERDTIKWLKKNTADGSYFDATAIGFEMGFDRPVAASKMRRTLRILVERGVVEKEDNFRARIYRAKQ